MPDTQDQALIAALNRLAAGQAGGDDLSRLQQAVAEGRLTLQSAERTISVPGNLTGSTVLDGDSQSGGVNFGQSNQIQISGSVIGTMTLNLPSAAEAARLLDLLKPFQPEPLPPAGSLPAPGTLPPGSRLPLPRNAVFVGREADLLALADSLLHADQSTALTGTGGVGKTQLAIEFCYRFGRFFQGVYWLHADQNMLAEIAACGTEMDLQPWPDTLPEQAQTTLEAWERGEIRLVVLDDVVDVEVVQVWLPKLTQARILVTSRRGEWPPDLGLALLPLVTMPRRESLALLRKLASRLEKNADGDLDKIADRLGDLPLALDLAGRYLSDRRGLSLAGFLTELDQVGGALQHSALKDWTAHNPTQHDTNLAASFTLSWNRLASSGEASALQSQAHRMFCAAGYCAASTPIPWQVFYRLEGAVDGKEQAEIDKALGTLEDGGLISLGETGALIQRLLTEFARLQDGAGGASALPRLAQTLGELAYEANESGLAEQFKPLRAHVEISCGWAEAAELEQAGTLWSNLGSHLQVVAEYSGAKAAFERALRITDAAFGPDHPTVAIRINNLGKLLVALGEYSEAKAAFDRALAIRKEKLGDHDPDTATTLNDLGYMYQDLGDYDSARSYFEQALSVYEHALGEKHPWVATAANNLGSVLQDLGDLAGAKAAYERALAIDEQTFGPDHPKVAIRINNLGGVLHALGDDVEAQSAFERALAIDEQTFGPDHPDVARDLNNLGSVLRARGDLTGAKAAYERALHIGEAAFGPEHPNVAIYLSNLGNVLQDMGDLTGAKAANERALAIDEATFGPEHPNVAIRVNNLGKVLQDQGDYAGAKAAFERALAILEKHLPPDHPDVQIVRANLEAVRKK